MSTIFLKKNSIYKNTFIYNNNNAKHKNKTNQLSCINYRVPITNEWNDTIYKYQNDYIKLLPSINKTAYKFVKSYLNFYQLDKNMKKNKRSRRMRVRFKRLSNNKIFIVKSGLKWTNKQVNIDYNIFNSNKINLLAKIQNNKKRNMLKSLKKLEKRINLYKFKYKIINEKINSLLIYNNDKKMLNKYIVYKYNLLLNLRKTINKRKTIIVKIRNLYQEKIMLFKKIFIKLYQTYIDKLNKSNYHKFIYKLDYCYTYYILKLLTKEKRYLFIKNLILKNETKFNDSQQLLLKKLLTTILENKVNINFINLKYYYLNSDILSESISTKLKKKKRKSAFKTLKKSIRKVRIPKVRKFEKIEYKNYMQNLYNKLNYYKLFMNNTFINKDTINYILANVYNKLYNNNLDNINNKFIKGIKLQSSGRLLKRLTASRSVKKKISKGALKNRYSSYDGLSSKLVRGNLRSNIQYTKINSKTRNGSFGIKLLINNN